MLTFLKNALLPHEGNNYRPDILERFSMGAMFVLVLLSFALANIQALLLISSDWLVSSILPSLIVDLTNEERVHDDMGRLTRSEVLDRAATQKAEDMARYEYFAHYSPTGVSPWHWFDEVGYDYLHAGENLAIHFTDSDAVVDAWMSSPTHRENILNENYHEIGVGTARGTYNGHTTIYVVQLFGTQRMPLTQVARAETNVGSSVTVEKVSTIDEEDTVAPAQIITGEFTAEEQKAPPEESVVSDNATFPSEVSIEARNLSANEVVEENSQLISTTREGEPVDRIEGTRSEINDIAREVSLPLRTTTVPRLWLQTLYSVLALVVVASLLLSLAYEWRHHHMVQTAYAGGLLAVMAMLLYVHASLTGTVTIL